ncbi:hypothetical protein JTP94_08340 [Rhizobium lusitanum]|uniref:YiiX/YebB-like N1pC/P60 family cysteine hydrolase n=1 Tax=Rhizobium sp. RCAM05973 TaxID=2994066 RepID=UPI00195CA193|nr:MULTISPECIES: YiiX/YebB-like N1pC/P60 family cysteine hydrolase [Rhizobium]MBM7045168.1 hypothetical protein [Rhizobium lusitanum]
MKKLMGIAILCACLVVGTLYATAGGDYPPLQDGDLIFQTSTSSQSSAIIFATGSAFSHMGIIKNDSGAITVIEAAARVKETPLKTWVNRGLLRRVAIYRDPPHTRKSAATSVLLPHALRQTLRPLFLLQQRCDLLQRTALSRLQGCRHRHWQGTENI